MSNDSGAGMTVWVNLAVQAVGPAGSRPYEAWLAEVERVAVDLWLMSAPGGSTARLAADLSSCTSIDGVLAHAHVDGERGSARLVVRVPDGESGGSVERTFHTEALVQRRARDVLERAQPLVGQGVRLLVADSSGNPRVLHISDSGERERGSVMVRSDRAGAVAAPSPAPVQVAAQAPAHVAAPGPVQAVAPVQAATAGSFAPASAPTPAASAAAAPVAPISTDPAPAAPIAAPEHQRATALAVAPPPLSAPSAEVPAPPAADGLTWEEGSLAVWRNINRSWSKAYRTSCLLALRDRVIVDDGGLVLNLDELITLAQQSPDPDTPRGKDIAARYPA
ncbi:hypothetical protein GCM10011579_039710 [Streptomyces albiflavescens]|uniref:Uncharacterized protein n=1 Tax=Streptomyces albiflavescens TaxID=1623582 RepID=A0A918D5N9_9ACTN|nr:hypothetical protein [Streptomyces albiflavescens]GGN67315.1 hypothetical protein GCM10011579_039710 [Streptomyces albiflavescens]